MYQVPVGIKIKSTCTQKKELKQFTVFYHTVTASILSQHLGIKQSMRFHSILQSHTRTHTHTHSRCMCLIIAENSPRCKKQVMFLYLTLSTLSEMRDEKRTQSLEVGRWVQRKMDYERRMRILLYSTRVELLRSHSHVCFFILLCSC